MTLLGIELSDAGIMVAGADPIRLLPIDGQEVESPAFALQEKKQLTVGREAERKAHLYPRQILSRFWDQLNTEPLQQPNRFAENHAEIAYDHLARIWESIKGQGNEILIAVPGFFQREHLGLILGIARKLSIPVKGFVNIAVAASTNRPPEGFLLHLDIHLHRSEATHLKREDFLTREDSLSAEESGIGQLYKVWANAMAEEFVRTTRFDPFHRAASEQELYDRLPLVLNQLQHKPTVIFEMTGGSKTYHVTLTRELFSQKSAPVFREIFRLIEQLLEKNKEDETVVVPQLSHRLARLPGFKEMLVSMNPGQIIELEPGAGAIGVLRFKDQLFEETRGGAPFFTSRPLSKTRPAPDVPPQPKPPTHLLCRNIAYPITEQPLFIGQEGADSGSQIRTQNQSSEDFQKHCSIQLQGQEVLLRDFNTNGIFVNEHQVDGSSTLSLGQVVRVETSGETFQLIACLVSDET